MISRFSREQDAIILAEYPGPLSIADITVMLNAVTDGFHVAKPDQVHKRAVRLGVKRNRAVMGRYAPQVPEDRRVPIELWRLIAIGRRDFDLPVWRAMDPEAVSRAARRVDPGFVGYRLVSGKAPVPGTVFA